MFFLIVFFLTKIVKMLSTINYKLNQLLKKKAEKKSTQKIEKRKSEKEKFKSHFETYNNILFISVI
jgi:hypothetical protein